jgi:hypothetical protein
MTERVVDIDGCLESDPEALDALTPKWFEAAH